MPDCAPRIRRNAYRSVFGQDIPNQLHRPFFHCVVPSGDDELLTLLCSAERLVMPSISGLSSWMIRHILDLAETWVQLPVAEARAPRPCQLEALIPKEASPSRYLRSRDRGGSDKDLVVLVRGGIQEALLCMRMTQCPVWETRIL